MRHLTPIVLLLLTLDLDPAAAADQKCGGAGTDFITAEKELMECLLDPERYNLNIRPVNRYNQTVDVMVNMHIVLVENIDEKNGIMQTNGWMHQRWIDVQLTWSPGDYDGIEVLRVPADSIWKPDVILYNTAMDSHRYVMDDLAIVHFNGTVDWVPHARYSSFCALEMKRFPFDTQTCHLIFGSWNYDTSKVNLTTNATTRTQFRYEGREWDMESVEVRRNEWSYGTPLYYSSIQYMLTMKRIPTYHRQVFVFPSVVLACLTMFIFFIPPEAGERLTLAIGIVLAITLQITLLDQYLPTAIDSAPAIVVYLTFDLVMVTFAIALSIMTLNFYHRDIKRGKVPDLIRRVFLGRLAKFLCMQGEVYSSVPTSELTESTAELRIDSEMMIPDTPLPRSPTLALEKTLDEIRRYLKILSTKSPSSYTPDPRSSHRQIVLNEWHQLALVVDRLMFWIFLVLSVLISVIVYA